MLFLPKNLKNVLIRDFVHISILPLNVDIFLFPCLSPRALFVNSITMPPADFLGPPHVIVLSVRARVLADNDTKNVRCWRPYPPR